MAFLVQRVYLQFEKFLLSIFTVFNLLNVPRGMCLLDLVLDLCTTLLIGSSMDSQWCFPPPPLTLTALSLSVQYLSRFEAHENNPFKY